MANKFKYYREYIARYGLIGFVQGKVFRKETITCRIKGKKIHVRPESPDLEVAKESLGEELEPLRSVLDESFAGLIVDAGGYIGTSALKLSAMYPSATVVTVEPSSDNFRVLQQNIAQNNNIRSVNAALVSSSGATINLSNRETGEWGFTVVANPLDNPDSKVIETVSTVSLGDLMSRFSAEEIGVLKMDIEGGEMDIFQNSRDSLDMVTAIFVELHDRIVDGCSEAFKSYAINRVVENFGGEKWLATKREE